MTHLSNFKPITEGELRAAAKVTNPLAEVYQQMLEEGIIPPEIIASQVLEHITLIKDSGANDAIKHDAINELQSFVKARITPYLDLYEAWSHSIFGKKNLPRSYIHFDPKSQKFAGHIFGKPFKSGDEDSLHRHLTQRLGFHPNHATKVIQGAKSGNAHGNIGMKATEHSAYAVQHAQNALLAHTAGNFRKRDQLLTLTHHHMDKAMEHSAKEHKAYGYTHPELQQHLAKVSEITKSLKKAARLPTPLMKGLTYDPDRD